MFFEVKGTGLAMSEVQLRSLNGFKNITTDVVAIRVGDALGS
jgi:hypothetical protein